MKRFLSEVKQGVVPETIWQHTEVGNTQEAKKDLLAICDFEDSTSVFITPKQLRLLKRILEIATDKDSLVLDSFTGSGTTGHSVLALNKRNGGTRRFILVEMEEDICRSITAQRQTRAVKGYAPKGDEGQSLVEGLGGGFRFCSLGEPLFDETGSVLRTVTFPDLAAHVFFTETGTPIPKRATGKTPLIGEHDGKAVDLLFNGVMGDKSSQGGNVLTHEILRGLPESINRRSETAATLKDMVKVVYGEGCRLGAARLKREGIVFKQVPYEIKVS